MSDLAGDTRGLTRRGFLGSQATAITAGGALALAAPLVVRGRGLSERLRIGFVGTGNRAATHLAVTIKMQQSGGRVEPAAVCDVYSLHRRRAAERIEKATGNRPRQTADYRELLDDESIDAVCIATPDHWHAKQILDALAAGKHIYCEKPMTHTADEAQQVLQAWQASDRVVQVGAQRTSDPRWKEANRYIREGRIGKVVQAHTEYCRNSRSGQWRYYELTREMTPKNIDWPMFLGTQFGLAPEMPFDRALFRQWRCYWPFSLGLFSDLFVHRITEMLVALGVRFPRRVTAGGGIFLEYDQRDVPDTVTLVADYDEGLQLVVSGTMVNAFGLGHLIRGYYGTIKFDLASDGFDLEPERPQITQDFDVEPKHVEAARPEDETYAHWENFVDAVFRGEPAACHNPPDLGAAAVAVAALGAESYRRGQVFEWDAAAGKARPSSPDYAEQWETMSKQRAAPRHVPGFSPARKDPAFSRQVAPEHQRLAGPWANENTDPADDSAK